MREIRPERRERLLIEFSDPRQGTRDGIVAIGGVLIPENVIRAYRAGIFPWPIEGLPFLTWFCPPKRAILDFADLRLPRSLSKVRRNHHFRFSIDQAFPSVIEACAVIERPRQNGTWITRRMVRAYTELHRLGHAHSVEAWENDELVGGLYGMDAGGVFAGESMFHLRPNASKLALLHLIDHLSARGSNWIDVQVISPHMAALGAKEIHCGDFLKMLKAVQTKELHLFGRPG